MKVVKKKTKYFLELEIKGFFYFFFKKAVISANPFTGRNTCFEFSCQLLVQFNSTTYAFPGSALKINFLAGEDSLSFNNCL